MTSFHDRSIPGALRTETRKSSVLGTVTEKSQVDMANIRLRRENLQSQNGLLYGGANR